MITRRTKIQLIIFALITMVGVSFVGARYARLDRLVFDESYSVVAHFPDSGGIFTGAEVAYRGVTVGKVSKMTLTSKGVDVTLNIDKSHKDIPEKTKAVVANRSAVGEQFVDLQPQTRTRPYLADGSDIPAAMTSTPIETTKLLTDLNTTVNSVDKQSLRTVVGELGKAFNGTGPDLGRLVDTSNSFINAANDNFDVTTALLEDSNTVLSTQIDKTSDIKSFARDLSLFSDTLASSDPDLRRVIDNGSATANQLRSFLAENKVDLGQLINNLVTTGEVTGRHLAGTELILVVYPYVVAGGYTVIAKDSSSGPVRRPLRPDPPAAATGLQAGLQHPSARPEHRPRQPADEHRGALHRVRRVDQRPRGAEHPAARGSGVPGPGRRNVRSVDAPGPIHRQGPQRQRHLHRGRRRADGAGVLEVAAHAAAGRAGVTTLTDDPRGSVATVRPDDTATDTSTGTGDSAGPRPGARLRWGVAAALALLIVLALVAVAVEVVSLRPRSAETRADQAAQSEVVRAAERFTVQVNTYDAGSMDSYQSAMNSMMSPKFRADYQKVIDQLASTIKQAKVSSKGDVLASAVASVDTDSAQVLVVSDASVKTIYDPNLARHFRWEVSLVKINGTWLVNDFTPVA